ncbi:hypothetical protein Tco_0942936 [Tanacetum coccineum]
MLRSTSMKVLNVGSLKDGLKVENVMSEKTKYDKLLKANHSSRTGVKTPFWSSKNCAKRAPGIIVLCQLRVRMRGSRRTP